MSKKADLDWEQLKVLAFNLEGTRPLCMRVPEGYYFLWHQLPKEAKNIVREVVKAMIESGGQLIKMSQEQKVINLNLNVNNNIIQTPQPESELVKELKELLRLKEEKIKELEKEITTLREEVRSLKETIEKAKTLVCKAKSLQYAQKLLCGR